MVCDILHIYHALCNMPHALCLISPAYNDPMTLNIWYLHS